MLAIRNQLPPLSWRRKVGQPPSQAVQPACSMLRCPCEQQPAARQAADSQQPASTLAAHARQVSDHSSRHCAGGPHRLHRASLRGGGCAACCPAPSPGWPVRCCAVRLRRCPPPPPSLKQAPFWLLGSGPKPWSPGIAWSRAGACSSWPKAESPALAGRLRAYHDNPQPAGPSARSC